MMLNFEDFHPAMVARENVFEHSVDIDTGLDQSQHNSPSEHYAREVAKLAVQKVPHPASRHRVQQLLLPTLRARGVHRLMDATPEIESVEKAWAQYVSVMAGEARVVVSSPPKRIFKVRDVFHETLVDGEESSRHPANVTVTSPINDEPDDGVEGAVGTFLVSSDLLEAWIDGLNAVRLEAGLGTVELSEAQRDIRYVNELTRQLRKVVSNFAIRKSYDGGRYRITFGRQFLPSISSLIVDHLMLPPEQAVVFLRAFRELLYTQSTDGSAFKGRWGNLAIDDANELVLILHKRRSRKLSTVLKA
ncbi:hypothetical protein [Roseobacter sp. CCS2]|uniref:hypothetical protein n=1 Tax=Roseobacter sp. CCS2 TaxID=391593 RepID=UPI0000F402D6|nr:hypothetical protein [Roseobacter sp. CCS2]EBA13087.1 hypothetical protein RCCS2_04359 [Roseobacter sp. CCS2]